MALPESDQKYLEERGIDHQIQVEGRMTCAILPHWKLPKGYQVEESTLLLRLQQGYPDVPPDMWWFDPAVTLANGATIQATEQREQYLGRTWQRWSRHFQVGQWKSGIDGLESYLALIRSELLKWVS